MTEAGHRSEALLGGLRVIDLGQMYAAPLPARYLVDLGAEIIKVELPPLG